MTATDFYYFLWLGLMLGIWTGLRRLLRAHAQHWTAAGANTGLTGQLARLRVVEHTTDLDPLIATLLTRYGEIVAAFSAGALEGVGSRMSAEIRTAFEAAINARPAAALSAPAPIPCRARIVAATVSDTMAVLSLACTSRISDGANQSTAAESTEIWTFERPTAPRRADWILVGTQPLAA